jgi:hypothetical protein
MLRALILPKEFGKNFEQHVHQSLCTAKEKVSMELNGIQFLRQIVQE